MASYEWFPKPRNYVRENAEKCLPTEVALSHPLKAITVTEVKKADKRGTPLKGGSKITPASDFIDPLTAMDPIAPAFEGSDPLSMFAAEARAVGNTARGRSNDQKNRESAESLLDDTFEPWSLKKAGILSKYTTSEKLSLTTSFLSSSEKEKVIIKSQQATTGTVTDKVKVRLEQLDDFEEGSIKEMLNLSQQDYVNRIEELNQALITAWENDQRVKSLKIAIQCAKLLSDTSVIQFYPSKFVFITDILDTFGRLVYDRLYDKAQYLPPGSGVPVKLPKNFTPDQVPESAKETCRNWFFKIASIRELIPRFYVEAAIIKCYCYLNTGEYDAALMRLQAMTRGIGDPLCAIYARAYLCRVGINVAPSMKDHLLPCFNDFLTTYALVQGDMVQDILAMQKIEMPLYLTLYSPALDWILQCIAHNATEKTLMDMLESSKKHCNSALLLNSVISAFKPEYIAVRAAQFTELIRECEDTGFPKHLLYKTLGLCLVMTDPPEEQKLPVLNEVWKTVMKLKNPEDYITCAEVWIEYVAKHFGKREVNTILADIIKHMIPDRAFEDFYPQLHSVVSKLLVHLHDFSLLFSLDKFMSFIDMFQRESVKVDVCKSVMEAFAKYQVDVTNDPVVINALMFICKTMHDSVNALTLDDERRVISSLIIGFIKRISFGRDFEQQLSFYVEARAAFTNLDSVMIQLVQSVNSLAIETRKVVKGNHSRKTAAFVRGICACVYIWREVACAAYTFITIPSLQSVLSRLHLYLVSGQVAILNQCYSQGDAFFKGAISLIPEVPKTIDMDGKMRPTESLLIEYINNFLSTLLVVPDNPDSGVLYLLRGLINVIQEYSWEPNSDARIVIYMRVLAVLSASSQESYVYHVDKVDSNDAMYGSDPKYLNEINSMCNTVVSEVLTHLKSLSTPETFKRQSQYSLEMFAMIISHGDICKVEMFKLAVNLWNLSQKHGFTDTKQMVKLMEYVKSKAKSGEGKILTDLLKQMPLESRT